MRISFEEGLYVVETFTKPVVCHTILSKIVCANFVRSGARAYLQLKEEEKN